MKLIYALLFFLITSTLSARAIPLSVTRTDYIKSFDPIYISLVADFQENQMIHRTQIFGYNPDVDTGASENVWYYGGQMSFPSENSFDTLDIVSSSSSDGSGAAGARSIYIKGIGSGGQEIEETLILSPDATNIATTTNSFLFVNRAYIASSGSSKGNVGNITISQTNYSTVMGYIPIGYSVDHQGMYRVPANHYCHIDKLSLHAEKQSAVDPRVTLLVKIFRTSKNTEYIIRRALLDTDGDSHIFYENFIDEALIEGDIVSVEASTDSNNTEVAVNFEVVCRSL